MNRVVVHPVSQQQSASSGMVVYQTWAQRQLPDAVRGRVFTWLDVAWNVMKVVSLELGGTMLVIAGLTGLMALRDVRLEQSQPVQA